MEERRKIWRFGLIYSFFLSFVLQIPYLAGYALTPKGKQYMGLIMNPEDSLTYFSKMNQGYWGSWLYSIPFTGELHESTFLGGVYLFMGHLARWLGVSVTAVWHGARFVTGLFLFVSALAFIMEMIEERRSRKVAFGLATLGSGLGWLLFVIGQPYWLGSFPVDFKAPEAHLFFMGMTYPHVSLGTGLIFLYFILLYRLMGGRSEKRKVVLGGGGLVLLIGIAYPFLIYLIFPVTAVYWGWLSWRAKKILWGEGWVIAAIFGIAAPLFLYYGYILQGNEVFSAWSAQSVTSSPPWPHYLVAYGVMLLIGGGAAWKRYKGGEWEDRDRLLWAWIILALILLYSPLKAQRRFVQGLQLPLAIVAADGFMVVLWPWISGRPLVKRLLQSPRYSKDGLIRLFGLLFILIMSISSFYTLLSATVTASSGAVYPFVRLSAEIEARDWIDRELPANSLILTSYNTGNFIGGTSKMRAYTGHWAETVRVDEKNEQVSRFFDLGSSDEWRINFLTDAGIDYIWYGLEEKKLGGFDPAIGEWALVYAQDGVQIYQVMHSD